MEGCKSVSLSLVPDTYPVEFKECWKSEADQYNESKLVKNNMVDKRLLHVHENSNDDLVFVLEHVDPCLVWIGKSVVQ